MVDAHCCVRGERGLTVQWSLLLIGLRLGSGYINLKEYVNHVILEKAVRYPQKYSLIMFTLQLPVVYINYTCIK